MGCLKQPVTGAACPLPPPGANPCEHAGKCINTLGSFECQCLQGYTGPRCEIDVNECISNPCQNDATCLDQIGEFQCICMPGTWSRAPACRSGPCSSPCLNPSQAGPRGTTQRAAPGLAGWVGPAVLGGWLCGQREPGGTSSALSPPLWWGPLRLFMDPRAPSLSPTPRL